MLASTHTLTDRHTHTRKYICDKLNLHTETGVTLRVFSSLRKQSRGYNNGVRDRKSTISRFDTRFFAVYFLQLSQLWYGCSELFRGLVKERQRETGHSHHHHLPPRSKSGLVCMPVSGHGCCSCITALPFASPGRTRSSTNGHKVTFLSLRPQLKKMDISRRPRSPPCTPFSGGGGQHQLWWNIHQQRPTYAQGTHSA